MINHAKPSWLAALGLGTILVAGCHKAPKQYNPGVPPKVAVDPFKTDTKLRDMTTKPTDNSSINPVEETTKVKRSQEEEDNLVRKNVQQPILYGVGAAGVSLTSTEDVIAGQLSDPAGYYYNNTLYVYKENIYVVWGASKPRTPQLFLILPGYLGTLSLPAPYGEVRVGSEYPQFFAGRNADGVEFIKAIYRAFEHEDENYNCLERGSCQINDADPEVLVFETPGAHLYFSRDDRHALSRIDIQKAEKSPEDFNNDFDLVHGRVLVSENQTIDLGTTWADAKAKARTDSPSFVNPTYFFKRFRGINMTVSRSHFEVGYNEPADNEVLEKVQIAAPFAKNIRLGKKFVRLTQDQNQNLKLVLEDSPQEGGLYLKPTMPKGLLRNNPALQKELLTQLAENLKNEIAASDEVKTLTDKGVEVLVANPRYMGFNNDQSNASFTAAIDYYYYNAENPAATIGRTIWFRTTANEDNIFFSVGVFRGAFDDKIVPANFVAINPDAGSLAGLNLGDKVLLSDEDLGRGEVTLNMAEEGGKLRTIRSSYQPDNRTQVAYSMTEEYQTLDWLQLNEMNFGVNKTGRTVNINGKNMAEAEINVIVSGTNFVGVENLCHLDTFETGAQQPVNVLSFGTYEDDFSAILKNSLVKKGSNCAYYSPVDGNQNEQDKTRVLYFPDQQMKLYFGDHELSSVMIYKKPAASEGGN